MAQEFDDLAAAQGIAAARRWYWKQACLSAPPLVLRRLSTLATPAARGRRLGSDRMLQNLAHDLRYGGACAGAPGDHAVGDAGHRDGHRGHTAIFSVMEGVFLRPLPFPAPDRLVRFSTGSRASAACRRVNVLDARDCCDRRRTVRGDRLV
jgi:hypothetical protein